MVLEFNEVRNPETRPLKYAIDYDSEKPPSVLHKIGQVLIFLSILNVIFVVVSTKFLSS